MPTCLELAGVEYPSTFNGHELARPEGQSLLLTLRGNTMAHRTLAWEHEGNRAIRVGDWKLVARYRGDWELYDLREDRTECVDLAKEHPQKVAAMAAKWQAWADRIGVLPWKDLPASDYQPTREYRKK
jgi:arylsulfatase A-like enzyme